VRLCDYCALEIQDEAVYCRYCHRQLRSYAGIRGKIRCPYCAEWIERDAAECEFCDHVLTPAEPEPEPEPPPVEPAAPPRQAWDPRDVLLEDIAAPTGGPPEPPPPRRSRFFGMGVKSGEPAHTGEESAFAPETEIEIPRKRVGLFGLGRSGKEPPALEPLPPEPAVPAALWGASYIEQTPLPPSPDLVTRGRGKPPPPPQPTSAEGGRGKGCSSLLIVLIFVVAAAVVLALVFRSGMPDLASLLPPSPQPTATQLLPTAAVLPTFPPATPVPQGTPGEPQIANCLGWDEVTAEDVGQTLCVYGDLRRWFAADEIPFVALFSEERGTFAIVDREGIHYEVQPGSCIMVTGEVELMAGTRPFIDADGTPLTCP